jgi:UDP-N-acetylmuramate dehydrogenase
MDTLRKFIEKCNIGGSTLFDEPMSLHTTLKIGGPADAFVRPQSVGELMVLLTEATKEGMPVTMIGGGANLLVADRGIRGLVISTESLRGFHVDPNGLAYAEAGLSVVELGNKARELGFSGLEFAAGLPGSVGGAVYMNARCYGREFADVLVRIEYIVPRNPVSGFPNPVWTRESAIPDRAAWAYKRTPFMPGNWLAGAIIVGAAFQLVHDDSASIAAAMAANEADRQSKGHFDYPSAGSFFKNNRAFFRPTGSILDGLGFKGRRFGDAMVNPRHANIFVNAGSATAADMLALMEEARQITRSAYGFELEAEVVLLGDFSSP